MTAGVDLQMWRVAADILNMQSLAYTKEWFSRLFVMPPPSDPSL